MMELRKATPLLRGEVQGSSRDPLSHLRGAVERFGRKLRPLSLDQERLLPRLVFHSLFPEYLLQTRLCKVRGM